MRMSGALTRAAGAAVSGLTPTVWPSYQCVMAQPQPSASASSCSCSSTPSLRRLGRGSRGLCVWLWVSLAGRAPRRTSPLSDLRPVVVVVVASPEPSRSSFPADLFHSNRIFWFFTPRRVLPIGPAVTSAEQRGDTTRSTVGATWVSGCFLWWPARRGSLLAGWFSWFYVSIVSRSKKRENEGWRVVERFGSVRVGSVRVHALWSVWSDFTTFMQPRIHVAAESVKRSKTVICIFSDKINKRCCSSLTSDQFPGMTGGSANLKRFL